MYERIKNIVMWALTYRCNMACDYCFLRNKVKKWKELTDDECLKIADYIAKDKTWRPDAIWLTGGEPTVKQCLADVVRILESAGIKCVITTNGFCNDRIIEDLLIAGPKGINISLESTDDDKNDVFRGYTQVVLQNIKKIAHTKKSYTILGVSCVVSQHNIDDLFAFAEEIKRIGVDYLSINPLIGNSTPYKDEEVDKLIDACKRIRTELNLITPSDYYLHLLKQHLSQKMPLLKCPSGDHYFFISPWGKCYPCSNEIWQKTSDSEETLYTSTNIKELLSNIQYDFHTDSLTTCSNCFGDRCIGCWKLYYDTVFT